ncbi:hypothetical protein OG203_15750 [Nocardia sp. NBC_01499]|uniref:hypothetical protein n=1 Tax=Nocardia sp. NBC_01499 TaxID=2903597 RepID=UPI00386E8AA1
MRADSIRSIALLAATALIGTAWVVGAPAAHAADIGYECSIVSFGGSSVYAHNCKAIGGAPANDKYEKTVESKGDGDPLPAIPIKSTKSGKTVFCSQTYIDAPDLVGEACDTADRR